MPDIVPIADGLPAPALRPEQVFTLPELQYPARLNVARELLDANADGGRAGRPAIVAGERVITYGELQTQVNRLANGLVAHGLDRGDRVLLRMPNVPEFILTWLACQKIGLVLKPGRSPSDALAAELQEHCKRELAPYKYPRVVEFVERLPRTETGKIRRFELRAQSPARVDGG